MSIWGGGAILGKIYGTPTLLETFLNICSVLMAFSLILVFAFDQLIVDSVGSQIPVPSMLHLIATLGTLFIGFLLARAISMTTLPATIGFVLIGFQVTLMYNFMLPVETGAIKRIIQPHAISEED